METIQYYFGEFVGSHYVQVVIEFVKQYPYFIPYLFFFVVCLILTHFYFKERNKNIDLDSKLFGNKLLLHVIGELFIDNHNELVEKKNTLEEVRKASREKNLKISNDKRRILELELACLFMEDAGVKDLASNLAMFRKMTIKQLENERQSWKGSKIIKTKLEKNK